MSRDELEPDAPDERTEPVGAPVVRGDPEITGERARRAVAFDPDDPESLADAAATVRAFATAADEAGDQLDMLRGAAACAALVRGVGSYTAAAAEAGDGVTVSFLRKWARVHDLPIAIRRHIALGDIAPTAAMHLASVTGNARFLLAWSVIDNDLTVAEVREIVSAVGTGQSVEDALAAHGVTLGEITLVLPASIYRELRRIACLDGSTPGEVVATRLADGGLDG